MLKNIVDFWLQVYKWDAIVTVSNAAVTKYVNQLIKRSLLKGIIENVKPSVIMDEEISGILQTEIYYIGMGTKKHLINFINKNCGLDLDPYTKNFKLVLDDKEFIFIQTTRLNEHNDTYCKQLQMYHLFKTLFLDEGVVFDPMYKYCPATVDVPLKYQQAISSLVNIK